MRLFRESRYKVYPVNYLNDFDYIIALSDFVKDSYVAAGFPSSKIFVASSDLDTGQFFELNRVDNGKMFRVLYVAHTSILKGLHYLLNAWQMLDIPNKELTIVGVFKDMTSELRTIYNQALLDPTIKWTGNLERDVLLKYYASASVFVLPSLTEGNPRVVLEAMVARLPIITTMHARGLVQRGKSGFVVPIRDAQAIMEKLEFLYRHPDIAKQMGDEARRTVETKKPTRAISTPTKTTITTTLPPETSPTYLAYAPTIEPTKSALTTKKPTAIITQTEENTPSTIPSAGFIENSLILFFAGSAFLLIGFLF